MGKSDDIVRRSLDFYKGSDCNYKEETEKILKQFAENSQKEKITFSDFSKY